MKEHIQDLVIIGGGVMGLFTAYAATPFTSRITILEKSRIGDKKTASFGYTRSIRLDVGIYGHPIYEGRTPGVKIGFYNPPGINVLNTRIHDVASFVEECMPCLQDAEAVEVTEVDQCFYDLVADDNFILGSLPGFPDIAVGVGWRGTGYKYAPWVGQVLMQLALQQGTVYDISRFSPCRFLTSTM